MEAAKAHNNIIQFVRLKKINRDKNKLVIIILNTKSRTTLTSIYTLFSISVCFICIIFPSFCVIQVSEDETPNDTA